MLSVLGMAERSTEDMRFRKSCCVMERVFPVVFVELGRYGG